MIVDITPAAGVVERPLSDYLDERSYFYIVPKEVPRAEKRMEILIGAKSKISTQYGWAQVASIGSGIVYGWCPWAPGHWRLWTDVVIMMAILSVPRRWHSWWPDLMVRVGHRYLRTLIVNRLHLDVERPSVAFVMAFEPMLARRGFCVARAPEWSEIRRVQSRREQGSNP